MAVLEKRRALGFAACALASSLWGCGFFFGKIALAEMGFAHMVLYRFLFAMVVLLPLLVTHRPGLNRREWGLLVVASFMGVPLQFLIQFYGLSITTVSHAALMVGTMPVILAVGAAVFAHERMDWVGWVALAGSTCGAGLIALGGGLHAKGGATLAGDALVVVSLLIALFWILFNKELMGRHSHIVVTAYGLLLGTLMLMVWVPVRYGMPPVAGVSVKAWLALAASGVLCTAATTLLWNWGMTQVPASQAGVLLNMEPLIGSLLGVIVLGERLGPSAWVGGGLILASAVTLTTRSKTRVREDMALAG
ncbi:DMT family transporter [Tunturiibacter gelidoferens]|uniref:Drug/metabolite transporter (DMT)-like permease n=2 Tax=Tunturiibacter TaxID=3154218 RepID=A0A7Y9NPZ7_9BACT|nr:EamA family transporter [Edaphobacter lichenicola]MBB5341879.1 drug/metabolite transporter (DMT)-like permease [Edaphobacter lichenicola]NYF53257.1 drug/metabolite transporter (DMT)-like permease [Edaphobacter lichenicola]